MGDAPRDPASRLVQLERDDDAQIVLVVERREQGTPSGEVELARVVLPMSVLVDAVQQVGQWGEARVQAGDAALALQRQPKSGSSAADAACAMSAPAPQPDIGGARGTKRRMPPPIELHVSPRLGEGANGDRMVTDDGPLSVATSCVDDGFTVRGQRPLSCRFDEDVQEEEGLSARAAPESARSGGASTRCSRSRSRMASPSYSSISTSGSLGELSLEHAGGRPTSPYTRVHPLAWRTHDVATWLRQFAALGRYVPAVRERRVTGVELMRLAEDDDEEEVERLLGIAFAPHRRQLLRELGALRAQLASASAGVSEAGAAAAAVASSLSESGLKVPSPAASQAARSPAAAAVASASTFASEGRALLQRLHSPLAAALAGDGGRSATGRAGSKRGGAPSPFWAPAPSPNDPNGKGAAREGFFAKPTEMVAGGAGGGAAKAFAHHLKLDLSAMAMEHAAEQSFE